MHLHDRPYISRFLQTRRTSRSFSTGAPSSAMRYYSVILSPQHWCPDLEKQKMDVLSPLVSSKMLIEDTDIMFAS